MIKINILLESKIIISRGLKNDITRLQGELGLKEGMNITLDNKLNDLQQDVLALENQLTNKDRTIEVLVESAKNK